MMAISSRLTINGMWSIDTTSQMTVSISSGILKAAVKDNVQPLALLACERYGATLAMCPRVRLKMENLGKTKYTSHTFQHLALTIGWSGGEHLIFLPGCQRPQCAPARPANEILYCKTINAAAGFIGRNKPQLFRVVSSSGSRPHFLYLMAAAAYLWRTEHPSDGAFPVDGTITVVRGDTCLPCACAVGFKLVNEAFAFADKQMVIILD